MSTKLTVSSVRNYMVRAKSVLADTDLAGKVAQATAGSEYERIDSWDELIANVSQADLLAAHNEAAKARAESAAKTSSPWGPIETTVEMIAANKRISFQDALDVIRVKNILDLPTVVDEPADVVESESEPTTSEPTENPASGAAEQTEQPAV